MSAQQIYDPSTGEPIGVLSGSDGTLRLQTESIALLHDVSGSGIQSTSGSVHVTGSLALSEAIPAGENKIGKTSITDISGANEVAVLYDEEEDTYRLATFGKVSVSVAPPPDGGTAVTYAADNPLSVNGTEDVEFTLPDGEILHIQQVVAGAAGDPNEKGSVVEIFFVDTSSVLHLIERIYVSGFTEFGNYPDTSETRDGLSLLGDTSGTPSKLLLRRRRVGGAAAEIDAVVRGYTI